jgi:Poly-beta-hydroxybutyrate polymerase N terminal
MTLDQNPVTASGPGARRSNLLHEFDRKLRGHFGILLGGQSPWAALQAWEDWAFHLMLSRGRQIELGELALEAASSLYLALLDNGGNWIFKPAPDDRRFRDPSWNRPPFNLLAQAQLGFHARSRQNHSLRNGKMTCATASGNSSWIDNFPAGRRLTLTLGRTESASISARDFAGV